MGRELEWREWKTDTYTVPGTMEIIHRKERHGESGKWLGVILVGLGIIAVLGYVIIV